MKYKTMLFTLLLLPLTLFLDLILFAMMGKCPSCGSFWEWVRSEGALSFPLVIGFTEWFEGKLTTLRVKKHI